MKNTRNIPLIAAAPWVAVALGALLLTGCSGDTSEDPSPSMSASHLASPEPSETPTVTETPAASQSPTTSQEPEPEPPAVPVRGVVSIAEAGADGSVTVGGFFNGFAEDGGACTFVLDQGSTHLEKRSGGLANMGATACGSVIFPASQVASGTATVRVDYAGASGNMTTETERVTIP